MNIDLVSLKKSSLALASLLLINSSAFCKGLQINWLDNSTNEDGFIVERKSLENDNYKRLSTLPANVNHYIDSDVISNETYCYRIIAFNQAGQSPSVKYCLEVNDISESIAVAKDPIYSSTNVSISHQFINKPVTIEVNDKELYSFKSKATYNEAYSDDEIYNVNFSASEGKVRYSSRDYFSFQQKQVELANGYVSMKFNTGNSLSFDIQTNGTQTAILYMKAGSWSRDASSIIVTVGDEIEKIILPKGYTWHYFSVAITIDGTVPIHITTDSNRGAYSSVMFAGIVLNEAN